MSNIDFSHLLRKIRERKGLTQAQLAQALNYTQQAVAKWEANAATPDPDTLRKIAKVLEVKMSDLLEPLTLFEEQASYMTSKEMFESFFNSTQFKEIYKINPDEMLNLTKLVIELCELYQLKSSKITND